MEFHVERSTAVGIHPIKAMMKNTLLLSNSIGSTNCSQLTIGPCQRVIKKAIKVDTNKTAPINLIRLSNKLNLPLNKITIQIAIKRMDASEGLKES